MGRGGLQCRDNVNRAGMMTIFSRQSLFSFLFIALCLFHQTCLAGLPAVNHKKLVADARSQIWVTVFYDSAYRKIAYPGGDVPAYKGVCADVVVRALRGQGLDLQKLIHEDMQKNFSAYPKKWGLRAPDSNIDHRRVPNIATFLRRSGKAIAITQDKADYQPGDIVTWNLKGLGWNLRERDASHIGIVSDKKSMDGVPLVIHNIGWGTRENDSLFKFRITGHFRL